MCPCGSDPYKAAVSCTPVQCAPVPCVPVQCAPAVVILHKAAVPCAPVLCAPMVVFLPLGGYFISLTVNLKILIY